MFLTQLNSASLFTFKASSILAAMCNSGSGRYSLKYKYLNLDSGGNCEKALFVPDKELRKLSRTCDRVGQLRIKCSSFSTSPVLQSLQNLSERGILCFLFVSRLQ